MMKQKLIKIAINIIYGIGTTMVIILSALSLWGGNEIINYDVMLPYTQREWAFSWLVLGCIPMAAACAGAYFVNDLRNSNHRRRNLMLISVPGIICIGCLIFVVGLFTVGPFIAA